MIRIPVILFLVITLCENVAGQITVSGFVTDKLSGERLIDANVFEKKMRKGTVTNAYGYYSISFKASDTLHLIYSYIGYGRDSISFPGVKDTVINIALIPDNNIREVTVTRNRLNIEDKPEMSVVTVPVKMIKKIPALGGEPDIIKVLQLLPGVQSGDEGKSGLYVRGGSPDQNLILLDDVPLYYVNHLGGFVSTFNPDALSRITLYKGGGPARYGSRLSSVVDVRMKDGNMKKLHGTGTLGMISAKMMLEGPIKKDTASYLLSVRRFMYDLIMRPASKIAFHGFTNAFTFYDVNAKINVRPNFRNRFYFSFYAGNDHLLAKIRNPEENQKSKLSYVWGNLLGALRWNHVFGNRLFSNTTLTYTRYRYKTIEKYALQDIKHKYQFLSAIRDIRLKSDMEYAPFSAYTLRWGVSGIIHKYIPTSTTYQKSHNNKTLIDTSYNDYSNIAYEWNTYLENEFKIGGVFSANLGARYSSYSIDDTSFSSFQPRIMMNIKLFSHTSLKASYNTMQQYIHLLTSSGAGMAVDYWVPTTKLLPPENARQYAIGLAHTQKDYEIELEGYYKKMDHLITFSEGIAYLSGNGNWQEKVDRNGQGQSYGIEFLLRKNAGILSGWMSYTYSKTTRQFEDQNFGKPYPFKYDRRHTFNITATYQLKKNINLAATWVFGSGNPVTLAISHYYVAGDNDSSATGPDDTFSLDDGYHYGSKNSIRMRSYHRLDVGANFTKQKKWGKRTWNVSIYNLYNRQNPYFYVLSESPAYLRGKSKDASLHYYQQSLFPIMPSVSYSIEF